MKKRSIILILCLVFIALLTGGFYYVNKVVLPSVVRQKIVQGLSDFTSSKVALGGLRLNLLKGLVLEDLVIYDKDTPQQRLAEIKELSAGFLILPSFKEKKVIIPSLSVREATLTIGRRKDGTLTIAYLLEKIKQKNTGATASMPSVIVRQISIKDGAIVWADEALQPAVSARIRLKQAQARLGLNKAILNVSGEVVRGDATTYISIDADYVFSTKNLSGRIVLRDLDMARYLDYLPGAPYAPTQGIVDTLEASFTLREQKTLSSHIQLHSRKINAAYQDIAVSDAEINANLSFSIPTDNWSAWQGNGQIDIVRAALRSKTPVQAEALVTDAHADVMCGPAAISITSQFAVRDLRGQSGDTKATGINASIHAQADIPRPGRTDAENIQPKYKGSLDITSGELDGLPYAGKAKIVSFQASFEEKNINLTRMSAELLGTTIAASGTLKDNALDLKVSGEIGLAALGPIIREHFGGPVKGLSGDADADIRILADLAQKKTSVEGTVLLQEPALAFGDPALPLKASGGRVSFNTQEEKITWHLEDVPLLERTFVLDGTWTGFKTSSCVVKAIAQDMMFEANVNKTDNVLDISSLKLSAKDSRLDGTGQYDLATAAFHLNAGGDINIADLKEWVPQQAVFEKPIDLNGLCHIQFDAAGPAKSWTSWKVNSNITSKALHIKGFAIKDITLNYTQTAGQGLINFLNFKAYNGAGTVKGRVDLNSKGPRYSVTGEIKDLDLNLLKSDIPDMKDKTFYGKLSIQAAAEGTGADTKSISGQSQVVVTDGNIWEFNPLKGLGNFIFMPRFDTLSFSHATGDFTIKDGWMATENLDLMGDDVELLVKGKIGFDGTLDLVAVTQVPTTGPGQSPIGEAVNTAGGMTAISITGSIEKPQYKLQPITQNIFKKLGDLFSSIAP
jgi:hypothetical protein